MNGEKDINELTNPEDIITIKKKLENKTCPCNIAGLIKEILDRIKSLEVNE